uniref:Uncharacterized protein n=1 Tax=Romanomermis culicivorax TaxID=13658 RepID=A0A915I9D9_ROMCU
MFFTAHKALKIQNNSPGPIPQLSREVSNAPGGWRLVAQKEYSVLASDLNQKIKELEAVDAASGSPRHKLIKIREAISQVVAGINKKVVFTVGELNNSTPIGEINQDGQYVLCYFALFYPLRSNVAQVQQHVCVAITKQEAYQ